MLKQLSETPLGSNSVIDFNKDLTDDPSPPMAFGLLAGYQSIGDFLFTVQVEEDDC